jgi:hypothetical protein
VAKFYHRAMPQEQVAQVKKVTGRSVVLMDGIPFPFVGYPLEKITTIINVRDYAQNKLRGIRCHVSQIDPASPYLQESFELADNPWFWQETYILARHQSDLALDISPERKENDLFAGLR